MVQAADYGEFETAWCPGCGNFAILDTVKKALSGAEIAPQEQGPVPPPAPGHHLGEAVDHQAAIDPQAVEAPPEAPPSHRVEDHVHPRSSGQATDSPPDPVAAGDHHLFRPVLPCHALLGGSPYRPDDPRPEGPADLAGRRSHAAGRGLDHEGLTLPETRQVDEAVPGGDHGAAR